jgi:formylglycine-generating enzyme required for sulfatase activity
MVSPMDGMTLVYVPAGEFLMGSADSDGDADNDEKPQHRVYLDAFWMDRTEVTKDQYQQCVAAGKCAAPSCRGTGQGNHPVVCVSWQDAADYCTWAGRRLPTEAEWEKAARGTDGRKYPWGNQGVAGNLLNFCDSNCGYDWRDNSVNDGYRETAPVGSYPAGASSYGALDMAGNVWEWVGDWYDEKYYAGSPARNPTGPASGQARVVRGGSCSDGQGFVRAAVRYRYVPDFRDVCVGFRCARSP